MNCGNRPTNTATNPHTGPITIHCAAASAQCNNWTKNSVLASWILVCRMGSVLGPLLFLLYLVDLFDIVTRHGAQIHFYADDGQMHITSPAVRAEDTMGSSRTAFLMWKHGCVPVDYSWTQRRRSSHCLARSRPHLDKLSIGDVPRVIRRPFNSLQRGYTSLEQLTWLCPVLYIIRRHMRLKSHLIN